MSTTETKLSKLIQFTDVNPDLTREGILAHLALCKEYDFHAAMISPCWVELAADYLKGTGIRVATTVNFPQATDTAAMKAAVIPELARMGANEFDFPPNPAYLLSGMFEEYRAEVAHVVTVAHDNGLVVKGMLEFGYLPTVELKKRAALLCAEAGIDWVKNGSGWGKGGSAATVEDLVLLVETVGSVCGVKASGKVNSFEKVEALRAVGVTLFGTSSGVAILQNSTGSDHAY